ncbi:MAG: phage tail protein [Candidatus Bathyarchaeota archaeon]|nr:phage tail protein [Candidatus Bathyarchaeota archaeon]
MPQFTVNQSRIDPYKKFKFRVKWDNKIVAGVSKMSPLKRTTDVITHREGGDSNVERKSPGKTHYAPIVLQRGVTHDHEFESWANLVFNKNTGSMSLKNFRNDIVIELLNEAGVPAIAYKVYRCEVSEYTALPDLDAGENAVAIQSITIEHEGWERDTAVAEPKET